jgi:replicative DNA helicase
MDTSAIVLNKLITERNLDVWSKLKLAFVDPSYASIYSSISRHYEKYNELPTFDELDITTRENAASKTLALLKLIDEPDINAEVALDALLDQYTQAQTITMLEKFVDKLPIYDTAEIKENLSHIVLSLDEKTLTTEGVYTQSDIMLFHTEEEINKDRVYLGLNNNFDAVLGGVARQELILMGGPRGSGKSITSSNIITNQYEMGNTSVLFTIEMIGKEVNERGFAILADVSYRDIKLGTLSPSDMLKVVKARAGMFQDADDLVEDYTRHRDKFKFEKTLVKEKTLKVDNQIVIIDDRALTLTSLDLHLGKIKSRFGNKFKVAVVDYMNKVILDTDSSDGQFDWKQQIVVSAKMKELARKHDVTIFSPYQVDDTGEARFAKGILDAADIAMVLKTYPKDKNAMGFDTTKIRGGPPLQFTSPINWETLRISPESMDAPDVEKKKDKIARAKVHKDDSSSDIPWDT